MATFTWRMVGLATIVTSLSAVAMLKLAVWLLFVGGSIFLFWVWIVLSVVHERRQGHLPTTLCVSSGVVRLNRPKLFGRKEREWPVDQVRDWRLAPIRDLFGRHGLAMLRIRFRHGRGIRIQIKGRDPLLPDRVETALREVLGTASGAGTS